MWRPPRRVAIPLLLVVLGLALVGIFRADVPITAFRREIVVDVPRQVAWDHFARVREWPSWLESLTSVDVSPADVLGPASVATLHMGGMTTTFQMAEFDPPDHWMWTSRAAWFTLLYDHEFEPISENQTRMVFHMRVTGFGKHLFARLVDAGSRGGHAESFPRLVNQMNSLRSSAADPAPPPAEP